MLIEVEVTAGANSPLDLHRMFDLIAEPRFISSVFTADATGRDRWCDVTGWCESGACPAQAALSEDSGEGVVLVVYGGDQGIRLKPTDCLESWDLASPHQWGEACLLLDKDAPFHYSGGTLGLGRRHGSRRPRQTSAASTTSSNRRKKDRDPAPTVRTGPTRFRRSSDQHLSK